MPEGANVANIEDEAGETILVSGAALGNFQMQIYVAPFEGEEEINLEKVEEDLPDMKMKDKRNVKVGDNGLPKADICIRCQPLPLPAK